MLLLFHPAWANETCCGSCRASLEVSLRSCETTRQAALFMLCGTASKLEGRAQGLHLQPLQLLCREQWQEKEPLRWSNLTKTNGP